MTQAHAVGLLPAPTNAVKKVVNGKYAAEVDNGWVIFQSLPAAPVMNFYKDNGSGGYVKGGGSKLKIAGTGQAGTGAVFDQGGVVFAPCPAVGGPVKCAAPLSGPSGIGLGFGQATFGAASAVGGWVSDNTANAHMTNADGSVGSISGVAVDATNGAYAVGWDLNTGSLSNHAIVLTLDSAHQTYVPIFKTDLGTLGGATSQALDISKNAKYIAGSADDAANKSHAVYALSGASAWTDLTTGFSLQILKSRAVAAGNTGFIAGVATVKRTVAGKQKSVDIGFVYDTNSSTVKFFEQTGFDVVPLRVLDNGNVVGNLESNTGGAGTKADHPFVFDGTSLIDLGTMVLASTGQPAFGCRANRPNSLGELAGSCVPDSSTPYGVTGTAFYINAAAVSPAFIDVNAAIHTTSNVNTPSVKNYKFGTVTSIDDQHEITLIGTRTSGNPGQAAFIASQVTYNQ